MTGLFERTTAPVQRSRRWLYWTEALLLTAGLITFGWFGFNWLATGVDQLWSNYELEAGLNGEAPTVPGFLKYSLSGENSRPSRAESPLQPADTIEAPS